MRSTLTRLILVLCCVPALGFAAKTAKLIPQNPVLSRYLMVPHDDATMRQIGTKFEVQMKAGNGYVVIVPLPETQAFLKLAPAAELIELDMDGALATRTANDRGWHDFAKVQSDLQAIVAANPALASVEKYGESMEGRPLNALRLLSKTKTGRAKPVLVITAATHGNELITVEVLFGLVNKLLAGYGKDARLSKMVNDHELWFIPVVNPDGYVRKQRYCNGIDPNRNYPWPEQPDRDPNPAIKAIMDFFAAHDVKGSMDYHSAAGMIMYPWAYTYDPIPEEQKQDLDKLTTAMARTNGYTHGPIASTIYIAPGSSADYYYWKFGTRATAIEISQDGSTSLIPSMLNENMESTWLFIEAF